MIVLFLIITNTKNKYKKTDQSMIVISIAFSNQGHFS